MTEGALALGDEEYPQCSTDLELVALRSQGALGHEALDCPGPEKQGKTELLWPLFA
jgi:hypothetical protein